MTRPRCVAALLLGLLPSLAPAAPAQTVLQPGDIGIVTSEGFWRLRADMPGSAPVNAVPATAFGLAQLESPGVEWDAGSDDFLVCSGTQLFRVTILSVVAQSVTDITPATGGPARFESLDIHPGTGDLYLQDGLALAVFRFAPPFAAGMVPDLVLPTGGGLRAACLDSRDYPPSVVVATGTTTTRLPLDGSPAMDVAFEGGGGLDGDPQTKNRTYIISKQDDRIDASTGTPSLAQNLNIVGLCSPVALGPTGVAYNPIDKRVYVFAADGLNPACFAGGSAPNQVVSFPPALNPVILPKVLTNVAGSGITGSNGDLALVLPDFAVPAPYGVAVPSPVSGKSWVLDANGPPSVGSSGFALELKAGPALQPVFLLVGAQPAAVLLPSGGTVLVAVVGSPIFVGSNSANGKLTVAVALGPFLPVGLSAWLQCASKDAGHLVLSSGLQLHFAP